MDATLKVFAPKHVSVNQSALTENARTTCKIDSRRILKCAEVLRVVKCTNLERCRKIYDI